jgi:hypothetical protein
MDHTHNMLFAVKVKRLQQIPLKSFHFLTIPVCLEPLGANYNSLIR